MKVYVVEGWFGDREWIETPFYSKKEDAEQRCRDLWATRTSERGPGFATKLHKFDVAEYEVM